MESYQAAYAWWEAKKAEIDGQKPPHPHAGFIEVLTGRSNWARTNGELKYAAFVDEEIARIQAGGTPQFLPSDDPIDYDSIHEPDYHSQGEEPPLEHIEKIFEAEQLARSIDPLDSVWNDRVSRDAPDSAPMESSIGSLAVRFLGLKRAVHDAGQISTSEFDQVRLCVEYFRDWAGARLPIARIDANRWEAYYSHLLSCGVSVEYKKKRLRHKLAVRCIHGALDVHNLTRI
jgi:hypothetical protein